MTLLTTEVFDNLDVEKAVVVFAADRRISLSNQAYDTREKIFRVPGMPAGIGYFGLAEVPTNTIKRPMSDWLLEFLQTHASMSSLADLANELVVELNAAIPEAWRWKYISGFHLAGFDQIAGVVFWYIRNVEDDRQTLFGEYRAREDFRRRDGPELKAGAHMIYRNGDIRAHVLAWQEIDTSLGCLLELPEFHSLLTVQDYVSWVRFKMQTIARFYETFCTVSIIGEPIDAFAITITQLNSKGL
jgi:hypothetical protein